MATRRGIAASIALFEIMPQDFLPSDDTGQLRGSMIFQPARGKATPDGIS